MGTQEHLGHAIMNTSMQFAVVRQQQAERTAIDAYITYSSSLVVYSRINYVITIELKEAMNCRFAVRTIQTKSAGEGYLTSINTR